MRSFLAIGFLLAALGVARADDWDELAAKIKPGMARRLVEALIPKYTPPAPPAGAGSDAPPSDEAPADLSTGAQNLYDTPKWELDAYRLDERFLLVVPYQLERRKAKRDSEEGGEKERQEQKVASKPSVMEDTVVAPVGDAPEPFFKTPLPASADHPALDFTKESAHVLAGNLFGNGQAAIVCYTSDDVADAIAYYREVKGDWVLRTYIPLERDETAKIHGPRSSLTELSGDAIPEVALKTRSEPFNAYSIYRYDPKRDELVLALADIADPGWDGKRVGSFIGYSGISFAEKTYQWVGNTLQWVSEAQQGRSGWEPVPPPQEREGLTHIQFAERDPGAHGAPTAGVRYSWVAAANFGWITGETEPAAGTLWCTVDLGHRRISVSAAIDAEKMAKLAPEFSGYDLGNALFPHPEAFTPGSKIRITATGKTIALREIATVSILADTPVVMAQKSITLADLVKIPPLSAAVHPAPTIFEDLSEAAEWEQAFHIGPTPVAARYGQKQDLVLYISGPDMNGKTADLTFGSVSMQENTLQITCTASAEKSETNPAVVRPGLALRLGELKPGKYKARIEIAVPAADSTAPDVKVAETNFEIVK